MLQSELFMYYIANIYHCIYCFLFNFYWTTTNLLLFVWLWCPYLLIWIFTSFIHFHFIKLYWPNCRGAKTPPNKEVLHVGQSETEDLRWDRRWGGRWCRVPAMGGETGGLGARATTLPPLPVASGKHNRRSAATMMTTPPSTLVFPFPYNWPLKTTKRN